MFKATDILNAALFEAIHPDAKPEASKDQNQYILSCIKSSIDTSDEFLRKVDSLPVDVEYGPQRRHLDSKKASEINLLFRHWERQFTNDINSGRDRRSLISGMMVDVLHVYKLIGQITDYQTGLSQALIRAKKFMHPE